jgi:hypothetical protein
MSAIAERAATSLPPLRSVATGLRIATERLAAELVAPSDTSPEWNEQEWRFARIAAALHGVAPVLARMSRWSTPAHWVAFIDEQRAHTLGHRQRLAALTADLDASARDAGIAFVALKGAALHDLGLCEPGDRPMADLDLLLRPDDLERMVFIASRLGYRRGTTSVKHVTLLPVQPGAYGRFGERAANPIKIELHTKIAEWLPLTTVELGSDLLPDHARPGRNPYASPGMLMRHLLLHAAGNMCYRTLRLVQLRDIALLAARMSVTDWEETLHGDSWWAAPPLRMAHRYLHAPIPSDVLARAERQCRWLLKRVSAWRGIAKLSLSTPWIEAFPGIEWASTAREMLRYVAQRVVPPKTTLEERRAAEATDPWMAGYDWGHLSQARRVARWLVSSPPRIETISCVATVWREVR